MWNVFRSEKKETELEIEFTYKKEQLKTKITNWNLEFCQHLQHWSYEVAFRPLETTIIVYFTAYCLKTECKIQGIITIVYGFKSCPVFALPGDILGISYFALSIVM